MTEGVFMLSSATAGLRPYAPTILRIVVGIVFMAHGLQKLQGIEGTVGFFGFLGIPAPEIMAWVVALVETLGGLALILGLGTRYAAALLAVVMLVAILMVKLPVGLIAPMDTPGVGYELDGTLLAASLALLILGGGALSLEQILLKREL